MYKTDTKSRKLLDSLSRQRHKASFTVNEFNNDNYAICTSTTSSSAKKYVVYNITANYG